MIKERVNVKSVQYCLCREINNGRWVVVRWKSTTKYSEVHVIYEGVWRG